MEKKAPHLVLYEADSHYVKALKETKEKLYGAMQKCMHRPVHIQTVDGRMYEGVIVHTDGLHMYIQLNMPAYDTRAFFPGGAYYYNNVILPLVLYELLVISLLYS